MANSGLFSSAGGDRGDKPNVLVVITDGKTNSSSKAYSSVLAPLIVSWLSFPSVIAWLLKSLYSLPRISVGNSTTSSTICTTNSVYEKVVRCSIDSVFKKIKNWRVPPLCFLQGYAKHWPRFVCVCFECRPFLFRWRWNLLRLAVLTRRC